MTLLLMRDLLKIRACQMHYWSWKNCWRRGEDANINHYHSSGYEPSVVVRHLCHERLPVFTPTTYDRPSPLPVAVDIQLGCAWCPPADEIT